MPLVPARFIKKFTLVRAVKWNGSFTDLQSLVPAFAAQCTFDPVELTVSFVDFDGSEVVAAVNDWLMMNINGEFRMMTNEWFLAQYEPFTSN